MYLIYYEIVDEIESQQRALIREKWSSKNARSRKIPNNQLKSQNIDEYFSQRKSMYLIYYEIVDEIESQQRALIREKWTFNFHSYCSKNARFIEGEISKQISKTTKHFDVIISRKILNNHRVVPMSKKSNQY